jgi:hypothetical protein
MRLRGGSFNAWSASRTACEAVLVRPAAMAAVTGSMLSSSDLEA